ncbi:hypothetical protein [Polyangium spumosum]|uniref:Uncharacterized protein n=1 Tax=Polyangium spumosum TaxID=889282 RepID=A0A6N7Q6A2_9BACT|nr:hypothetical protein [Polyangium spumosum]MRG97824.1 hypothetical protein [Polyangium spumosum]
METELAFASDGTIYVHFEDEPPAGRRVFTGYALTADERRRYGVGGLLRWACLQVIALGSDGCVYVEDRAMEGEGRMEFRGYALTDEEAQRAFRELHRAAFNLTVAARRAE